MDKLIKATEKLLWLGNFRDPIKFHLWEEAVIASDLLSKATGYRSLGREEKIMPGDEVRKSDSPARWVKSKNISGHDTVGESLSSYVLEYRRLIPSVRFRDNKKNRKALMDAIEGLIYLGISEKYRNWENKTMVVNAGKLLEEMKGG